MACDPFWDKTVLACRFDGTNGSTTFADEKGHTLTANGNAQLTTTSPKFGTACAMFDGAGDYISIATENATDFNFGSGDFTIECWVKLAAMPTSDAWPSSWSSHMGLVCKGVPSGASGYNLIIGQTQIMWNSNDAAVAKGAHGMTTGTWYHVAVSRENGVVRTFVDGVTKGVSAGITSDYTYAYPLLIGTETAEGAWFNGCVDDVRITRGARYTADFAPPSASFLANQCAISGTVKDASGANAKRLVRILERNSLRLVNSGLSDATTGAYSLPVETMQECLVLAHDVTSDDFYWANTVIACQFNGTNGSTTFTDEKGHALTPAGNAQISTAQSKFDGASVYFDGTGDYLTAADSTDFQFGSGDFTIECWVYPTSFANIPCVFDTRQTATGAGASLYINTSGQIIYHAANAARLTTGYAALNAWTHLALVRRSGVTSIFVNGMQQATTYADTLNLTEYGCTIGSTIDYRTTTSSYHWQGYLDNLRVTKGVARYTASFVPPANPMSTTDAAGAGTENAVILDRVVPV